MGIKQSLYKSYTKVWTLNSIGVVHASVGQKLLKSNNS
jgi:hypothetical protein